MQSGNTEVIGDHGGVEMIIYLVWYDEGMQDEKEETLTKLLECCCEGDQIKVLVGCGLIGGYFKDRRYCAMLIGDKNNPLDKCNSKDFEIMIENGIQNTMDKTSFVSLYLC